MKNALLTLHESGGIDNGSRGNRCVVAVIDFHHDVSNFVVLLGRTAATLVATLSVAAALGGLAAAASVAAEDAIQQGRSGATLLGATLAVVFLAATVFVATAIIFLAAAVLVATAFGAAAGLLEDSAEA